MMIYKDMFILLSTTMIFFALFVQIALMTSSVINGYNTLWNPIAFFACMVTIAGGIVAILILEILANDNGV